MGTAGEGGSLKSDQAKTDGDPLILILDTNIWIKEHLLRTATGAAFLYAVRQIGGKLLLPDVTRREIIACVARTGADAVKNMERGLSIVQKFTGSCPGITLPSQDAFRQSAEARLNEISDVVTSVEILERHLRNALNRVIERRPPASSTEQFRDCLLWECSLDVNQNCLLVTEDGDFLDKNDKGKVLSPALADEGAGRVRLFLSIADALRSIQPQLPHINDEAIAQALGDAVLSEIERHISDQGWQTGHRVGSSIELYATERPNATAAVFTLEFQALGGEDLYGRSVEEGVARISGECILTSDLDISELALNEFQLATLEGDRMKGGAVFAKGATLTIGTPILPYSVRAPVPRKPA
jgi:hypothetical protein